MIRTTDQGCHPVAKRTIYSVGVPDPSRSNIVSHGILKSSIFLYCLVVWQKSEMYASNSRKIREHRVKDKIKDSQVTMPIEKKGTNSPFDPKVIKNASNIDRRTCERLMLVEVLVLVSPFINQVQSST